MNVFQAVKEFHEKYRADMGEQLTIPRVRFRYDLLNEELDELEQEIWTRGFHKGAGFKPSNEIDRANLTKELADLIYVTVGFAVTFGLPLEEVFKRVHESNMTKTLDNKREDGKVLKGKDYKPPYLKDLFYEKFYDVMPSESVHD